MSVVGAAAKYSWPYGSINWYPGHMAKGARNITERLALVDTIIEVRDARIPFSSRNTFLEELTRHKQRIIVFNKADLADSSMQEPIQQHFEKLGKKILFMQATADRDKVKSVIPLALSCSKRTSTLSRDVFMIVTGMPNVGKSTLINSIRKHAKLKAEDKRNVAKTGALPGVTRHTSSFRVSDDPPAYLFDTPGVMLPRIEKHENEMGLKIALTGAIKDAQIETMVLADYLLFCLNTRKNYSYVPLLGLSEPTDSISFLLEKTAERLKAKLKNGLPNTDYAAKYFIDKYRKGELGRMTLDELTPESR